MANRHWTIGIAAVLICIGCSSVGLYLSARDAYSEREIRKLIESAYNSQRPYGARLSGAAHTSETDPSLATANLGRAQILVLRQPDSNDRRQLQGLIHLAAGEWDEFVKLADDSPHHSAESDDLNNLGVSFLALSETDPTFLFKALDAFERACLADPKAPEPFFNLVITYKQLKLPTIANDALVRYLAVDPASEWHSELTRQRQTDEAAILDRLERAIKSNNLAEAAQLFEQNPELCRRVAMQYALSNKPGSPALVQFIAGEIERRYGDKTVSAMVAPLFTDARDLTIAFRQLVNEGANLWVKGEYPESLAVYVQAGDLAAKTNSVFDHLWLDLNRADTDIKLANFDDARTAIARITETATSEKFLWMNARALTLYGATLRLTTSYTEMLGLLAKANQEFIRLDSSNDRVRTLFYLSAYRYFGGDQDEALRLSLDCLRLIQEDDAIRTSALEWLIGSILYRRGMAEKSILFAKESVAASHKGRYMPAVEVQASLTLAELSQTVSEEKLAEEYLKVAEDAFAKMPDGYDRIKIELQLGILKAKARIHQQEYSEAELLLQRNLDLYSRQPFSATPLLSRSLMLMSQVYSETGRMKEAARKLTEAIDVVEHDDEYMKSEGFRVKFDDERRELYDAAIEFEFRNGSLDAAWTYLQQYRAKLFLEFLAAFNPDIQPGRGRLQRTETQRRIRKDTQIVEYALLKDRLLIWLLTDKLFVVRSVPVTRMQLEMTVQNALEGLRSGNDVDPLLTDLEKWLIEPISNLLDPARTIAIIPDRALHGLPFAALKQPGKTRYLIEDFPLVYSPSLTHFLTDSGVQAPRDTIVAFGSQKGGSSEAKELGALDDIYPKATIFTGQQVDRANFLVSLEKAPIFHYAGHSATEAIDALRSSILLDGDRTGPNTVTAVDISQQRLVNGAVVILSSCDSSVGNSRDGIGMRGLTSAFLIGGAGSVVGSLWPVEGSSTADLMIRFHRAFANSHKPVAGALREAQLAFLKANPERSHPYYWSGFVVTGNLSALR